MSQRIVFEFLEPADRAPEHWAAVRKLIFGAGGTHLSELSGTPPYIVTAVLPDEEQAEQVLVALRSIPGVGRADLDMMRRAYGGSTMNEQAESPKNEGESKGVKHA